MISWTMHPCRKESLHGVCLTPVGAQWDVMIAGSTWWYYGLPPVWEDAMIFRSTHTPKERIAFGLLACNWCFT